MTGINLERLTTEAKLHEQLISRIKQFVAKPVAFGKERSVYEVLPETPSEISESAS